MDRKVKPARVLAVLFMAGATLAVISILLPHPPLRVALLSLAIFTAYAVGAIVFRYADEVSTNLLPGLLFLATVLIGASIYASGIAGGVYGTLFFWVAVFAGLFFTPRMAAAHIGWVIAVNGVLLTQVANPAGFSTRWLLSAIAISVVAAVTNWIAADRNRIDAERQELLSAVNEMAHTDALTGLPNRRAWDAKVALALDRARSRMAPVCIALIDIDNLKVVNDRKGHAAGDLMLQAAAEHWKPLLRQGDYVARYGGDEFALLLNDCGLNAAQVIIERLRESAPAGQSCSAGVAAWNGEETAAELVSRADEGLYEAKSGGRNRLALVMA
jgi:diguanylate cyclase (GGDEF)-like protein